MSKRKITEIFEDKVVAEIYEKIRDNDGKRFYDTVIRRRYTDENKEERRTDFLQLRDLDSIHVIAVRAKSYIKNQLWQNNNNPGGVRNADIDDEDYATEE